MAWFRQMLEWQTELKDAKDFMDGLKIDLFVDEVFVFTPKGDVHQLPLGATPIDFAYHIHTEVGHRCTGSKVNGRIVSLSYRLRNGDIVEVVTGKIDNPSLDWLNFVKTTAARTKIKSWLKKRKRNESVERGRRVLEEELKKLRLHPKNVLTQENIVFLTKESKAKNEDDLYALMGYGEISAFDCARKIRSRLPGAPPYEEQQIKLSLKGRPRKKKVVQGIKVSELENVLVRFSKCCKPLPGDEIVGYVTKGRGVAIHRKDCLGLLKLKPKKERLVRVEWDLSADIYYPVEIEVEAFDRVGVFKDVLAQISESKTNVSEAEVRTKRGSSAFLKIVVDVKDTEHLNKVLSAVREVSDVYEAGRMKVA
jgi:GTP pyrophosphokinase